MKSITYGTKVLKKIAQDESTTFPLAAKAAFEDFYFDDFISGAKTVAEAIELRTQMEALFNSAGIQLRKWASICPEVFEGIPSDHHALGLSVDFDNDRSAFGALV